MAVKDIEHRKAWELAYKARKSELAKSRYAECRESVLARQKAYLKAHPEKRKAWQEKNSEALKAYRKSHYNPEQKRAYNAAYAEANRDRISANGKAYYAANKQKRDAYKKAYKATAKGRAIISRYQKPYQKAYAVEHADEFNERRARRKALKLLTRVEASINYKAILKSANGLCGICRGPFDLFGIHFDHIIPLSKGGTHTTNNIQATHARCNLEKGAKIA